MDIINMYSQNNPIWAGTAMKSKRETIGKNGNMLAVLTNCINRIAECNFLPTTINEVLKRNYGYKAHSVINLAKFCKLFYVHIKSNVVYAGKTNGAYFAEWKWVNKIDIRYVNVLDRTDNVFRIFDVWDGSVKYINAAHVLRIFHVRKLEGKLNDR